MGVLNVHEEIASDVSFKRAVRDFFKKKPSMQGLASSFVSLALYSVPLAANTISSRLAI
jgi:hypothetical protein